MNKRYKLRRDYESPCGFIKAGTEGGVNHWHNVFPLLLGKDPADYPDWFQEIKEEPAPSLTETHNRSMDIAYNLGITHSLAMMEKCREESVTFDEVIKRVSALKTP